MKPTIESDLQALWNAMEANYEDYAVWLMLADEYEGQGDELRAEGLRWLVAKNRMPMKRQFNNKAVFDWWPDNCGYQVSKSIRSIMPCAGPEKEWADELNDFQEHVANLLFKTLKWWRGQNELQRQTLWAWQPPEASV